MSRVKFSHWLILIVYQLWDVVRSQGCNRCAILLLDLGVLRLLLLRVVLTRLVGGSFDLLHLLKFVDQVVLDLLTIVHLLDSLDHNLRNLLSVVGVRVEIIININIIIIYNLNNFGRRTLP